MAIWTTTRKGVVRNSDHGGSRVHFVGAFDLSETEISKLFSQEDIFPSELTLFSNSNPDLKAIVYQFSPPPDVPPQTEGALAANPSAWRRASLSVFLGVWRTADAHAGDNGLGKSFLLDTAWWALTGTWAGRPRPSHPSSTPVPQAAAYHRVRDSGGVRRLGAWPRTV